MHTRRPNAEGERERVERASRLAPGPGSDHALLALQRSAGNRATTALIQRHFYKGNDTKTGVKVDTYDGLPKAAKDTVGKDPVARHALEDKATDPGIEQPVPDQHWDNPAFWRFFLDRTLELQDLGKSFKPGDKLYGVEEAREGHRHMLEKKKIPAITIDVINNAVGVPAGKLQHTQSATVNDYAAWLTASSNRALTESNLDMDVMWTNIKRACKAAVVYTAGKQAQIHFELAGLNIDKVLTERNAAPNDRRITGVELRSIYRSWFRQAKGIKEKDGRKVDMKHVTFYLNGKRVVPPWEWPEGVEAWKEYGKELATSG
jgi:hypothetical protein